MGGACRSWGSYRRYGWARARRALAASAVLAGSLASNGCSFFLVQGPPTDHEQLEFVECTGTRLAPLADVFGASLAGLTAGIVGIDLAAGQAEDNDEVGLATGLLVATGAVTLTYGVSAIIGYVKVSRCDRAQTLAALRRASPEGQALRAAREREAYAAWARTSPAPVQPVGVHVIGPVEPQRRERDPSSATASPVPVEAPPSTSPERPAPMVGTAPPTPTPAGRAAWRVKTLSLRRPRSVVIGRSVPTPFGGWTIADPTTESPPEGSAWTVVRAIVRPPGGREALPIADLVLSDAHVEYAPFGVSFGSASSFQPLADFPLGLGVGNQYATVLRTGEEVVLAVQGERAEVVLLFQVPRSVRRTSLQIRGAGQVRPTRPNAQHGSPPEPTRPEAVPLDLSGLRALPPSEAYQVLSGLNGGGRLLPRWDADHPTEYTHLDVASCAGFDLAGRRFVVESLGRGYGLDLTRGGRPFAMIGIIHSDSDFRLDGVAIPQGTYAVLAEATSLLLVPTTGTWLDSTITVPLPHPLDPSHLIGGQGQSTLLRPRLRLLLSDGVQLGLEQNELRVTPLGAAAPASAPRPQ